MTVVPHALDRAHEALANHQWQAAYDLTRGEHFEAPVAEAERMEVLADAAWWLGRLEECIEARQGAYHAFEDLGEHRRAGVSAVWLYENHCLRGRPAIGLGWLQRARRAFEEDTGCPEYGVLLLREAEVAHGSGQFDQGTGYAERARALGRQVGSDDLEAEALQALGRIAIDAGQVSEGLAHLDEAMLLAVEGRLSPYSTGKVYCSLISACEDIGDLARAAEWTDATAQWSEQHPLAIFPGICRVHRAMVLGRRGALLDAEREASRASTELLTSNLPNAAAAFVEVGEIRRRLGDLERAEEAFAKAEELSGQTCANAALLRLSQGRIDMARRIIEGCLAGQCSSPLARARILPAATQIALAAGDVATAAPLVDELEGIAATYGFPMLHAMASLSRGRLQLATHDAVGACATLHDAVRRWQALEVPYEVATTMTVLAQALREAGDEEGAQASFATARAMFDQLGARLEALGIDQVGPAPRPAGLTERETEVLRLVAAGWSNKDIAAELALSVKTISRHLSNIFVKIGVSSRSGATAFAFQQHLVDDA